MDGSRQARVLIDPEALSGKPLVSAFPDHQEIVPRKRRHEILHNQRGWALAEALRAKTDVAVTTLPFHLDD